MSELSGADRLLLSALAADGAEAIAAALAAHDPAADCPVCGVGGGSHALGCPRIAAPTAGQQPTGAALIRAILACGAFVPETQAELLRIAETLEIAEAMESLAPDPASEPAREMAQPPSALVEARRALRALYLEVPEAVARDVSSRVEAAFTSLRRPAPEPQRAEAAWHPAESAPRDGSHILVAQFNGGTGFGVCGGVRQPWQAVVHYWANPGEEGFYLSSGDSGNPPVAFTHWRPLDLSPDATLAREVNRG